jgi:DNA-binding NtrC family response regulator
VGSSKIRKVDVRILAATNADLPEIVSSGEFREDLLYRLNTVELHLPPLKERSEDIVTLALHFLERQRARYRNSVEGFAEDGIGALLKHSWPGNVRELEHSVERAVLMAQGELIRSEDLGLIRRPDAGAKMDQLTLDEAERVLIKKALDRTQGNVSRAADELGLSRSALYRRLSRYGLANESE